MRDYFKAMFTTAADGPRTSRSTCSRTCCRSKVDGEPLSQDDLLNMCVVLVLAGLDTTKSQLGYNFHYLATHPEDRRRLVEDP